MNGRLAGAMAWQGSRAFLAAGTIATTRILLRSLGAYDQTVWLKDSQYFLMPLLLLRRVRGATREWLHALSQVFLEVSDPGGQDTSAHIQIYSNNDLISQAVAGAFGPLQRPLGFLVRDLQERDPRGPGVYPLAAQLPHRRLPAGKTRSPARSDWNCART